MYQDFRYTLAHAQTVCTRPSFLVSCPDPTLASSTLRGEGKGSGEFGHNPRARERNLSAPMRLQL